jgi:hypothetical protein
LTPQQKINKKILKINISLMGICSNCHTQEKLQKQKLSQKHSKVNKSQEMQT